MKKLQLLLWGILFLFSQNQIIAQCPSLIQNPDFENGLAGWNVSATGNVTISTDAHSGSSAARICDGPGGFNQVFATQPGKTYDVSFWIKTEPGHDFSVYQIRSLDANWTPIEISAPIGIRYAVGGGIPNDNTFANYRSFEDTFTTPPNAAWFQVSVWNEGSGCLLIDDWSVCETGTPPPSTANLEIVGEPCPLQFPSTGSILTVPTTVKNTGGVASAPGTMYLYRSFKLRDFQPARLGSIAIPALQPGEEVTLNVQGTVQGPIPGTYQYSLFREWGNFFLSDEGTGSFPRNLKTISFYCQKRATDLSVEVIPVNTEYDASGEITFRLKVKNNGSQGAYNVRTVLSNLPTLITEANVNSILETSGATLRSTTEGIEWHISPLDPSEEKEITVTFNMLRTGRFPPLPNDYTIDAEVSSGHVNDTNASNNSSSATFTLSGNPPPPLGDDGNLTLTASSSSPTIDAWQFGEVTFTLKNEGDISVSNIFLDFRMDENLRLKGGDEFTASEGTVRRFWSQFPGWSIGTLHAGRSATVTFNTFALTGGELPFYGEITSSNTTDPTSTPANGTYPTPNEDDEAVFVYNDGTPPVGMPDLTLQNLQGDNSVAAGEPFSYAVDLINLGTANPPTGYSTGIYISTDNVWSADDGRIGFSNYGPNPPAGQSQQISGRTLLPLGLAPGDYFVIIFTDDNQNITESNENNNTISKPLTVTNNIFNQPDLTISNLFLDETTVKTGEVLNYHFDLANVGNANIPSGFNIKAYLSTDGDISPDDIQDGIVPTGNFDAGFSVNAVPGASTINLPEGDYYLILKVDADNQVAESDEDNNLIQSSIQFSVNNGTTNPTVCDKSVGQGNLSCFEAIQGTNNFKIAYDSSGWQIEKTLDANLDVIASSNPTQIPGAEIFSIDSTSLKKTDLRNNVIYEKTVPQVLADKMKGIISGVEFQGGYVFLAWRNLLGKPDYSTDELYGIRTDANFNILNEEFIAGGTGDPSGNSAYRPIVVNSNGIAFYLRTGFSQSVALTLYLIDGAMQIQDTDFVFSGAFGIGGTVKANACGRFTVTDFIGFSYCKSGGCYASHESEVDFDNNQINVLNSYDFEHRTQLGVGFENANWFTQTSDGGRLTANRNQTLDRQTVPADADVAFKKYNSNGDLEWERDYFISDWNKILRIYEENGEYFVVKNAGGLNISKLDCYDAPSPPGGADLDLTFPAFFASPAQWSFFGVPLTITNSGTEAATGIKVEFKKDDGLVYKGNDEFTASQGSFEYYDSEIWDVGTLAPGESAVLTVNYFRLTGNDLNIYAQVSAMDQADADSSPGNGSCCISNEDDEAILTLGSPSGNAVGNRSSIVENLDSKEVFAILNAAPNPITDRLTLNVFSNESQHSDLIIYDLLGKPVLRQAVELIEGHNSISVDASELPSGILTVTMSPNHPYLRQVRVMKIAD